MLKKAVKSAVTTTKEDLMYRYVSRSLYKGKRFISEALFPKLMFRVNDSERRMILIDLLTWVDSLPSTKFIGFKSIFTDHSAGDKEDSEKLRRLGRRIRIFTFEGHLYWIVPDSGVDEYLRNYDRDDDIDYDKLRSSDYDNAPMVLYTTFRGSPFTDIKKILVSINNERKEQEKQAIVASPNKGGKKMSIYRMNGKGDWEKAQTWSRDFKTVIMSEDTEKRILHNTLRWVRKKDRYMNLGIPHFRTIILVGPPGMGKTSLIRALATELQYTLHVGDISDTTTKDKLEKMFASAGPRSIVAFDDFDTIAAFQKREGRVPFGLPPLRGLSIPGLYETTKKETPDQEHSPMVRKYADLSPLKLRDVLQAFDGITIREEQLVVLCTNTLDGIDDAFLRKGRVDEIIHVGLFTDREVRKYIAMTFPDYDQKVIADDVVFSPISGADLQYLFEQNDEDAEAFVASIPTTTSSNSQHLPVVIKESITAE